MIMTTYLLRSTAALETINYFEKGFHVKFFGVDYFSQKKPFEYQKRFMLESFLRFPRVGV